MSDIDPEYKAYINFFILKKCTSWCKNLIGISEIQSSSNLCSCCMISTYTIGAMLYLSDRRTSSNKNVLTMFCFEKVGPQF